MRIPVPHCFDLVKFRSLLQKIDKMAVALNPVQIMKAEAEEERSETARLSSFVGAMAVGELVRSTLGPRGMDKILVAMGRNEGSIEVTNDGATILRNIGVDNPAAKVLCDISKTQDEEVGDGTTSVVVLASELLREAEKMVAMRLHPQTIINGYRKATDTAREALNKSALDSSSDSSKFRDDLMKIARTTLSSKILAQHKDFFSNLAVDAVLRLKGSGNLDAIQIIKKQGGTLGDSFLDEGFILDKKIGVHQPKRIENAKILVANTPMDTDKIKVFGSKIAVESTAKVAELELAEKEKMKSKVNKILNHNINVFFNRQLIYNYPEQLFADAGVMAIDHPELVKLGHCDVIEECIVGEDRMLRLSGVKLGEACTVVLRGATQQILDEAERSLHDALCVLTQTVKEPRTVFGGGCSETLMARAVMEAAGHVADKESLAMESFARALLMIPTIIADNAGYDSAQLVSELKAAHAEGKTTWGLNMDDGETGCMNEIGITESFQVKRQVLLSAAEAAEMILRVDDIIKAAPRRREQDRGHC